eukprot:Skav208876  [mRNA]  locus=scaffold270:157343:159816:- [translate_table: standard]
MSAGRFTTRVASIWELVIMARSPAAFVLAATACVWLFSSTSPQQEVFVVQTPALRGQGAFTGNTVEISAVESPVVLKAHAALPEPRPNDAMLPVEPKGFKGFLDMNDMDLNQQEPCFTTVDGAALLGLPDITHANGEESE